MSNKLIINTKNPTLNEHELNILFIDYVFLNVKSVSTYRLQDLIDTIGEDCDIPSFRGNKHKMLRFQPERAYIQSTIDQVATVAEYLRGKWDWYYHKFKEEYEIEGEDTWTTDKKKN